MDNPQEIILALEFREIESINEAIEEAEQERLTETDWIPKRERGAQYKTRPIDKIEGTFKHYERKKAVVRRRLYDAATLILNRADGGKWK